MDLNTNEIALIKSALLNDTVGKWGDGRKEKIDLLLKKINQIYTFCSFLCIQMYPNVSI